MRGLLGCLVVDLRLGEGRIVLKAERLAADRFFDRAPSALAGLAFAVGALGRSRKAAWPCPRLLRRDKCRGPEAKQHGDHQRRHFLMAALLACFAVTFLACSEWSLRLPR